MKKERELQTDGLPDFSAAYNLLVDKFITEVAQLIETARQAGIDVEVPDKPMKIKKVWRPD